MKDTLNYKEKKFLKVENLEYGFKEYVKQKKAISKLLERKRTTNDISKVQQTEPKKA